jgi:membrane-associated protein
MGFVLYRLLKSSGTLTQSMTLPVQKFIDWFLHLDQTLGVVIASQGPWTYGLLALIVFLETGVVVAPFLPGDSLLFAAGTFAGIGALSLWVLLPLLMASAIAGDTLNYWIGRKYGLKVYQRFQGRILKSEYLERTQKFYRRHGSRMIVLARFVPVVRTLAPFVAGVGEMTEDGALYTPTKGHYWEIISEDGAVIHDAHIIGELVISHTEYEGVAFPLLRYKTGDYARVVEDAETGDKRYEVLGRVDLDYIKIPGGEIRIEDVERAVKNIHPLLCDDFEVHVFPRSAEHPLSMEVRVASKTEITITEALSQELAQLLASRIHISPTRTYAHGVTDGLYAPLRCVVVAPFPKSHWKRRRMFQHE